MAKRILIIGGTRNMGYYLSRRLAESGADLTLLNRGITKEDLPPIDPPAVCRSLESSADAPGAAGEIF